MSQPNDATETPRSIISCLLTGLIIKAKDETWEDRADVIGHLLALLESPELENARRYRSALERMTTKATKLEHGIEGFRKLYRETATKLEEVRKHNNAAHRELELETAKLEESDQFGALQKATITRERKLRCNIGLELEETQARYKRVGAGLADEIQVLRADRDEAREQVMGLQKAIQECQREISELRAGRGWRTA